jgi:hypothetical protein
MTADITRLSKTEVDAVKRVFRVVNISASKIRHKNKAIGFQRADRICMASMLAVERGAPPAGPGTCKYNR